MQSLALLQNRVLEPVPKGTWLVPACTVRSHLHDMGMMLGHGRCRCLIILPALARQVVAYSFGEQLAVFDPNDFIDNQQSSITILQSP